MSLTQPRQWDSARAILEKELHRSGLAVLRAGCPEKPGVPPHNYILLLCLHSTFGTHPPSPRASAHRLTGTNSHSAKGDTDSTKMPTSLSVFLECARGVYAGSTGSCAAIRAFTGLSHAPGKNTFFSSSCHGNRLRARIPACSIPPVLSRSWLCVLGLWPCPSPAASRTWGDTGTSLHQAGSLSHEHRGWVQASWDSGLFHHSDAFPASQALVMS